MILVPMSNSISSRGGGDSSDSQVGVMVLAVNSSSVTAMEVAGTAL